MSFHIGYIYTLSPLREIWHDEPNCSRMRISSNKRDILETRLFPRCDASCSVVYNPLHFWNHGNKLHICWHRIPGAVLSCEIAILLEMEGESGTTCKTSPAPAAGGRHQTYHSNPEGYLLEYHLSNVIILTNYDVKLFRKLIQVNAAFDVVIGFFSYIIAYTITWMLLRCNMINNWTTNQLSLKVTLNLEESIQVKGICSQQFQEVNADTHHFILCGQLLPSD